MALFFDLQFPEDQAFCSVFVEENECIAESSMFDHKVPRCRWVSDPEDPSKQYCLYKEVEMSIQVIILVSILIATAQAPINILVDQLFEGILSAPLADDFKVEVQARHSRRQFGQKASHAAAAVRGAVRNSISLARNSISVLSNSNQAEPINPQAVRPGLLRRRSSLTNRLHEMVVLPNVSTRSFPPSVVSSHALTAVVIDKAFDEIRAESRKQMEQSVEKTERLEISTPKVEAISLGGTIADEKDDVSYEALENGEIERHRNTEVLSSFSSFKTMLLEQYEQLSDHAKMIFVEHWGFDPETQSWHAGSGSAEQKANTVHPSDNLSVHPPGVSLSQRLLRCCSKKEETREKVLTQAIARASAEAKKNAKRLQLAPDLQIGLEILHIFIIDLLGQTTSAAKIFNSMVDEDFKHSMVVTRTAKRLAWAAVVLINVFFVFFTVLRGMTSSVKWQQTFLFGVILQMLIEILLFETMECLWIHFTIPRLVSDDVAAAMLTVKEAINQAFENKQYTGSLDTPKYFFTSRKLAEQFPSSFEASVVLSFQSYFPPAELDVVHNNKASSAATKDSAEAAIDHKQKNVLVRFLRRFNLSVLVMTLLRILGTVPIRMQQVVMHTLQPIILSFIILLYLYFQRHPVLAVVPLAVIFYEILARVWKSKFKKKVVPVINDARKNSILMETFAEECRERQRIAEEKAAEEQRAIAERQRRYENLGSRLVFQSGRDQLFQHRSASVYDGSIASMDSMPNPLDNSGLMAVSEGRSTKGAQLNDISEVIRSCERTLDRKKMPDSSSNGSLDEIEVSSGITTAPMESHEEMLQRKLRDADWAVQDYMLKNGLSEAGDFEFEWDANSDEYKYLYDPNIRSFVDKNGKLVSVTKIMTKRFYTQEVNKEEYERNQKKANEDIRRKKEQMLEWDNYRIYKSLVVLPFVDSYGRRISEEKIKWRRSHVAPLLDASGERKRENVDAIAKSVHLVSDLDILKLEKQQCEHALMVW
eukprot:CAMPEP_0114468378 /NCGR_PEP_ID=MMETSP0104-20121206/10145_1 /TAXON_ID=37642 ORGANISM="Paraphysomonas imperforata, Strain PA2" /NCGR_SAMPLE_ID=MMETSP0104 /ASSEMBLY_ACC=CAM_ASM_000202 /LENGTH=988 /DNA_ID=CAMNT_0001641949 /DNA_START=315 /DNA_END=3278 /DNA_ORIENTATION=-